MARNGFLSGFAASAAWDLAKALWVPAVITAWVAIRESIEDRPMDWVFLGIVFLLATASVGALLFFSGDRGRSRASLSPNSPPGPPPAPALPTVPFVPRLPLVLLQTAWRDDPPELEFVGHWHDLKLARFCGELVGFQSGAYEYYDRIRDPNNRWRMRRYIMDEWKWKYTKQELVEASLEKR